MSFSLAAGYVWRSNCPEFALLLFASLFASPVLAGPALAPADQIRHDGLIASFDRHFRPEHVGDAVGAEHAHRPWGGCLTGLVMDLKASWHLFDEAERAEMTASLAPWKRDLVEPDAVPASADGGPPPPDAPCLAYTQDHHIEGEHFAVEFYDGFSESTAQDFLDSLEHSWDVEIEEHGWTPPAGTSRAPLRVTILSDNYAGAYTTVDRCEDGSGYVPYIVTYAGSFRAGNWYKSMAAHEFNHASQFSYGYAHEFWWWESTATYVEELVYENSNDWAQNTYAFALVPYIGMNAWDPDRSDQYIEAHGYGMAVWGFYLDEKVDGPDMVRDTWREALSHSRDQYEFWMPDVLDEMGYDFRELFAGFMATSALRDYEEREYHDDPALTQAVSELPASGGPQSDTKPQSLGQNFIFFDRNAGDEDHKLRVSFDGEDGPEWFAVLALGNRGVDEYVVFELDEDGAGVAEIDFGGFTDAHLIVSPMDEEAQGYRYNWSRADDWEYSWSAELVDANPVVDTGGVDTGGGDDGGGDAPGDGDGGKGGCGCVGVAAPASGLVWLIGLGAMVGRRRRAHG